MRKHKDKIGGQFVPVLHSTLDCDAWKALSFPARSLYIALKRKRQTGRGTAFLSYRDAKVALRVSMNIIARSFRELVHYGFIRKVSHGCLGVEGKGRATVWRLTELGTTRAGSSGDVAEPPSKDFLKWNGKPFVNRKTKPRSSWGEQGVSPVRSGPVSPVRSRGKPNRITRQEHKARG